MPLKITQTDIAEVATMQTMAAIWFPDGIPLHTGVEAEKIALDNEDPDVVNRTIKLAQYQKNKILFLFQVEQSRHASAGTPEGVYPNKSSANAKRLQMVNALDVAGITIDEFDMLHGATIDLILAERCKELNDRIAYLVEHTMTRQGLELNRYYDRELRTISPETVREQSVSRLENDIEIFQMQLRHFGGLEEEHGIPAMLLAFDEAKQG